MLFNSNVFILIFLPSVLFGFFFIGKHSHALASLWLAAASLFFYGWWDVRFVGLLVGSILFNYAAGNLIGHSVARQVVRQAKVLVLGAVTANLILLGYFKYANFFAGNFNHFVGTALPLNEIILPLGISFFTFTQIAFLADTYQGKVKEYNFIHYTLFVTYFPHLIAGPILHHKEMMPQFAKRNVCHINWENVAVGLSIFVLGLTKKVLLADTLADFSTPIFSAVAEGAHPTLFDAWTGALAYTLQLYFDFSGYSDMAIGLSLMFNVRLPMNFNSPYKATSIIEFWRRWHMTLSRFLRDYLYIPLGGSRKGKTQRYLNLMITMLLGGLWHGAGWTFIIWGGLHGLFLMVNHAWRGYKQQMGWGDGGRLATLAAGALTFFAVTVGWVFFRSDSFTSAISMLCGMAGMNGISTSTSMEVMFILSLGCVIVWMLPNVRQLFQAYRTVCEDINEIQKVALELSPTLHELLFHRLQWRSSKFQAISYGILFFILISYIASASKSEFLYFQF